MMQLVEYANRIVWGAPALVLILGVGLYLSMRSSFLQVRLFPKACRLFFSKFSRESKGSGLSSMQALCAALAATIGTGNIAGVAGAIALGGPGAIFWMWICALFGMITKFAEATLAVHYRQKIDGEWVGGPMYTISRGMPEKWRFLAYSYCFFGLVAAFGVGNATQINAVVTGLNQVMMQFGSVVTIRKNIGIGLLLAVPVGLTLLGGAKRIGAAAEILVPFAAGMYLLMGCGVLLLRYRQIPCAFAAILQGAFSPRAVTGGVVGSCFHALRIGVSRGVFTNEAGMGTASMAHASAEIDHPAEQGLMGIMEVFLDTVVICTMTALVILCSGVPVPYGEDVGAALTAQAFRQVYGNQASIFLTGILTCFAFATVLGWGLYGVRCAEFLFGASSRSKFAFFQTAMVVSSAAMETGLIWSFAELVNGLMAIPNLIALVILSPKLQELICHYKMFCGNISASGGTYENFNQCQSLPAFSHEKVPPLCGGGEASG